MPNWAYQEIHCKNKEDLEKIRNAFSAEPSNNHADIDFNKIIPMPKSIQLTKSPSDFEAAAFFLMPEKVLPIKEIKEKIKDFVKTLDNPIHQMLSNKEIKKLIEFRKDPDDEKLLKGLITKTHPESTFLKNEFLEYCKEFELEPTLENYGKQMLYNYMMYGVCDWYDWSNNHWDTKWNACNTMWGTESVYFQTAWSPSQIIPMEISKQLQIPLFVEWAEEQYTEYGGIFEIDSGEIIDFEDYDAGSKEMFVVAARLDDPDQQSIRYDENRHEFVFECSLWDEDHEHPYKSIEDIPKIDLTIDKLEEFKNN